MKFTKKLIGKKLICKNLPIHYQYVIPIDKAPSGEYWCAHRRHAYAHRQISEVWTIMTVPMEFENWNLYK